MRKTSFRYIPHTADVSFMAYGPTLKGAIESAAHAMLNLMFDLKRLNKDKGKIRTSAILVSAPSDEQLVWFTLQEIASKVDEKGLKAYRFEVSEIKKARQGAKLRGRIFHKDAKEYMALMDVKAVTPHNLAVKKIRGRWGIRVVLDV